MRTVSDRAKHVAAFCVLSLATLCCFHRLVLHPDEVLVGPQNRGSNDLVNYFIPSREYAARTLRDSGELPFWNPNICLGLPHTGNPQSALYYPPNWLCYLFPAGSILSWLLVAHHLFAGMGAYLLARRYGVGWCGGVIGGIVFLGAPYLIAQSAEGHYAQVCAVAWTPWAFLAYESVRQGSRRAGVLLALCLMMSFFCGHAQETYYLVLLLSGFVAWDVVGRVRKRDGSAVRLLGGWVRVGLYTVGLVAIDLMPIFINSRMTLRTTLAQMKADLGWSAFGPANLQQLLTPFVLSRPELWQAGTVPFWETVCFFGVVPLVATLFGIGMARRSPTARRMAALWVVTLLFAFGTNGPLYSWLSEVIPGLAWFRLPSRILFFTSFATAMLAGMAVDHTLRRLNTERIRLPLLYLLIAAGLFAGWYGLTLWQTGATSAPPALPHFVTAVLLAPALLIGIGALFRRAAWPIVTGGLALTLVLELSLFAHEVTETTRIAPLAERDQELLEVLAANAASPPPRILAQQGIIGDGDASRYGLHKLRGYEPAGPAAYLLLLAGMGAPDHPPIEPMGFDRAGLSHLNPQLLDLLNVVYAVQSRPASADPPAADGWTRIHSGLIVERTRLRSHEGRTMFYNYDVLKNESVLPRAFVVGAAREMQSWPEFIAATPEIDFRQEVVLADDVLPAGPRSGYRPARITAYSANHVEIEAELDAPGYLVFSDLWFPGWRVESGDGPLPVLRANMAFRAVPLPAGVHRLQWSFRPPGLIPGALVSAATIVVVMVSLMSGGVAASRLSIESEPRQSATIQKRSELTVSCAE